MFEARLPAWRTVYEQMHESGRRESNPLPQPWVVCALLELPTSLPLELYTSGFISVVLLTSTTSGGRCVSPADTCVRVHMHLCAGHLCEFGVRSLEHPLICRCVLDAREIDKAPKWARSTTR